MKVTRYRIEILVDSAEKLERTSLDKLFEQLDDENFQGRVVGKFKIRKIKTLTLKLGD